MQIHSLTNFSFSGAFDSWSSSPVRQRGRLTPCDVLVRLKVKLPASFVSVVAQQHLDFGARSVPRPPRCRSHGNGLCSALHPETALSPDIATHPPPTLSDTQHPPPTERDTDN